MQREGWVCDRHGYGTVTGAEARWWALDIQSTAGASNETARCRAHAQRRYETRAVWFLCVKKTLWKN